MIENKYKFIGPNHIKRARKTTAGTLAHALSEILYCGDVRDGKYAREFAVKNEHLAVGSKLPLSCFADDDHKTWTVERVLREVRDHLECLAIREVVD